VTNEGLTTNKVSDKRIPVMFETERGSSGATMVESINFFIEKGIFLTFINNKLSAKLEMSAIMTSAENLGMKSYICSYQFT
jgi:hypothetical protein